MADSAFNTVMVESTDSLEQVRVVLGEALQLGHRGADLNAGTPLMGNLPELDSMAVVTVISALETHFRFVVDDDDDLAQAFETLGSLNRYVSGKSLG